MPFLLLVVVKLHEGADEVYKECTARLDNPFASTFAFYVLLKDKLPFINLWVSLFASFKSIQFNMIERIFCYQKEALYYVVHYSVANYVDSDIGYNR